MIAAYTFSPSDVEFLKHINEARTAANAKAKNIRYSSTPDSTAGLIGLYGELALHRFAGVSPLRMADVTPRNASTDVGADCVIDGKAVDIKCTRKRGAPLWVAARKARSDTDVFALAYCDLDARTCEIVGFIDREAAMRPELLQEVPSQWNGGTMPTYIVPPSELTAVLRPEGSAGVPCQ